MSKIKMEFMDNDIKFFINNEILTLSLRAGLSRGNSAYNKKNIPDQDKKELKNFLRNELTKYSQDYEDKVNEEEHINNIKKLREGTSSYDKILKGGKLGFGRVQKLLNLYLKYLWVLNWIPEPPHCPFDRIILDDIKWAGPNWTDSKFSERDYITVLEKTNKIANKENSSIAKWELKRWNQIIKKDYRKGNII